MKTLNLTLLFVLIAILGIAQPSEATLKSKIKSDFPTVTSIEFTTDGSVVKEWDDGAYYTYYRRSYKTVKPTQYTGISEVYRGSIQYVLSGGSYIFDTYLIGERNFIGVPEPDKAEIINLLKSDLKKYIHLNNYNDIVGDISEITFPADPEFFWYELTSVEFLTNVTYSEKFSSTQVRKATFTYRVRIYADEFKGPWKSFISSRLDLAKNEGEFTTYTSEEIDAMKTLWEIDQEKLAAKELASLPNVDVKKFESAKQLFYYTHDIIMTKEKDYVLAYFFKTIDNENGFSKGSAVLMNDDTRKWVDLVLNNLEKYRIAHCEYPTVKEESEGYICFYDRKNSSMLRMHGVQRNDTWMLTKVDFFPRRDDELASFKGLESNCGEAPDLTYTPPREVIKYEIGDKVTGIFSNGEYNAFIDKKDPNISNRYFVKLEGDNSGKGYWMEEKDLKKGHVGTNINGGSSSSSNSSSSSSSSESFKVGDDVYVSSTAGKLKATIKQISGKKALVDYKSPLYDDQWVSLSNLSKEK